MKKILLAFDGLQFSQGAFEFARQLNDLHPILLTGVFMPQLSYANLWSYADGASGVAFVPMLEEDDSEMLQQNIKRFEELCVKHNIAYAVHKDYYDFALPELKKETRFADLLIISSETFYSSVVGENNNDYLKDVLRDSECPVIVVPERYEFPKVNIIAYDGSADSVYALKQFAYLFPELRNQETIIVYAAATEGTDLPQETQIQELAKQHFLDLSFQKLDVDPKKYFGAWLMENKGAILVSGSFGRSGFSELLRKSFSDSLIADHKLPVFIAHK
jgi:hypothetical protein